MIILVKILAEKRSMDFWNFVHYVLDYYVGTVKWFPVIVT